MPTPPLSAELCAEALAAYDANGRNLQRAADALGVNRTTFVHRFNIARRREALLVNDTGALPRGLPEVDGGSAYVIKGVSSYINKEGEIAGQWIKTKVDEEARIAAILAAIDERANRVVPLPPIPVPEDMVAPGWQGAQLLNLVTVTDFHLGMLAWHREGGDDWDITIARETFRKCFGGLLHTMPRAEVCVINQLGDFLHFDGMKAVTPEHGNILDADSRFQKIASVAADLLEELVLTALERHRYVHLANMEGNHDESGSAWLRVMFRRLFRDNPRVTVEDSPLPYAIYPWGHTLLGFHHGHKLKPDALPALFASQFREAWGASKLCHIHTGHQHHLHEKEYSGAITFQHPTLAARDAYAARGGWIAERRAVGVTYHYRTGEVGRTIVKPEMFGG